MWEPCIEIKMLDGCQRIFPFLSAESFLSQKSAELNIKAFPIQICQLVNFLIWNSVKPNNFKMDPNEIQFDVGKSFSPFGF